MDSPQADETAVSLRGVAKSYKLYDEPFSFFKEALTGRPHHREKVVLSNISLNLKRGEILGIIGRNGAGKSTLLKLIAGTLAPSEGDIVVSGRVAAILELGTGFNPNYSGRDNVILSALMRGLSEETVRRKFDSIVAFAGLQEVIDEPFHTYSSGMQARLAFAAATAVEADVLIIDEALAAGDIRFASKSLRRIREICHSGVTALFVSHTTYHVMQLCTRAIWVDGGRIKMDGAPIDVVRAYEYAMHEEIARDDGRLSSPSSEKPDKSADVSSDNATVSDKTAEREKTGDTPISAARPEEPQSSNNPPLPMEGSQYCPEIGQAGADTGSAPAHFSTGQYRFSDIAFWNKNGQRTNIFRFGELMRMNVSYECLAPEIPTHSCGLAVAFNRVSDFEAVMYYNTNYPHSDAELANYFEAPFRKYRGRTGRIEAVIDPLQLRAGDYFVSLGILPNQPGPHEFYEYIRCHCQIKVTANGFDEPSVFYPLVRWTNGPIET